MTLQASDFKVGDKVTVAADAETTSGGEVYFDGQVDGVVVDWLSRVGNVGVRVGDLGQFVAPQYLTRRFDEGDKVRVVNNPRGFVSVGVGSEGTVDRGGFTYVDGRISVRFSGAGITLGFAASDLEPVREGDEEPVDDCPFLSLQGECCGRPSACAEPEPELDHFEETGCDCEMDEGGDDYYESDDDIERPALQVGAIEAPVWLDFYGERVRVGTFHVPIRAVVEGNTINLTAGSWALSLGGEG